MRKILPLSVFALCFLVAGFVSSAYLNADTATNNPPDDADIKNWQLTATDGENLPFVSLLPQDKTRLLVNFWATWCPPCRHEIPLLEEATADLPHTRIIGISHEELAVIQPFIKENPITYGIYATKNDIFSYFQENGNNSGGLPFTVLLDENGDTIRHKIGDFKTLEEIKQFAQ